MSDGGGAQSDLLRLWFEAQAETLARAGHDAAWDRADELFRAWSRLLESFGPTAAATATPFDPSGWLKPAGDAGMAVLGGWLTGAGAAGAGAGGAGERPAVEWGAWHAALDRHRAITGRTWLAAFRAFGEESRRAGRDAEQLGKEPPDWDALLALWQEIADREFAALQRSDELLEAQARLLQAGIEARARARARVEAVAESLGLPTRAEIDDLTEAVHELRRELRALKADRERTR